MDMTMQESPLPIPFLGIGLFRLWFISGMAAWGVGSDTIHIIAYVENNDTPLRGLEITELICVAWSPHHKP